MSDHYVPLTSAANHVQRCLIEDRLQDLGIPFICIDGSMSPIFGQSNPIGSLEFRVPPERLQEAKDVLCSHGIVCDVSERLLRRTLDEVVTPLLQSVGRDFQRLLHLTSINNRETVQAIFERTLLLDGGRELLEDFFFALAAEESPRLLVLARVLATQHSQQFLEQFDRVACSGAKTARVSLLEVVHVIPSSELHSSVLGDALLDEDRDIRDAANEALYNVKGDSCGYDPDDPPERRQAVVKRLLG